LDDFLPKRLDAGPVAMCHDRGGVYSGDPPHAAAGHKDPAHDQGTRGVAAVNQDRHIGWAPEGNEFRSITAAVVASAIGVRAALQVVVQADQIRAVPLLQRLSEGKHLVGLYHVAFRGGSPEDCVPWRIVIKDKNHSLLVQHMVSLFLWGNRKNDMLSR